MSADDCIAQLQACRIRVAQLDATGAPIGNVYTTDGFQKITLTDVYKAGNEIQEDNACGASYIDFLDDPSFTRTDIDIDLITPDPTLHSILIANSVLLSPGSGGKGWAQAPVGQITGNGVSIEVWTKRIIDGALSQVHPYALWAMPLVRSLQTGVKELSNTAQHSLISGQCNQNSNWGDGPGNDFDAASTRTYQWIPVDSLPAVDCGSFAAVLAS